MNIPYCNQLIAEFMNAPDNPMGKNFTLESYLNKGLYHKSWDLLMPVVDRINEQCIQTGYIDGHDLFDMRVVSVSRNILLVYAGVVNYIEWYNRSKNHKPFES